MVWSYLKGAWRTAHFALTCSYANTTSSFLLSHLRCFKLCGYISNTKMGDFKNKYEILCFFWLFCQSNKAITFLYLSFFVYTSYCVKFTNEQQIMWENNTQIALGINCIYYYKQLFKLLPIDRSAERLYHRRSWSFLGRQTSVRRWHFSVSFSTCIFIVLSFQSSTCTFL